MYSNFVLQDRVQAIASVQSKGDRLPTHHYEQKTKTTRRRSD
jgi:hypothetical protein